MRVLFLLSCLEPAGSETYCTALAHAWRGKHEIHWISDRLHNDQPYTSMPIHRKAIPFGLINTWRVAQFIRGHRIRLVHSHSRRAHWVAAQAAAITQIPHVTTIHQPPPVHFFSKLFPCLGNETIAIDEVVLAHLRSHFKQRPEHLHLVRNGIDLSGLNSSMRQTPNMKTVLLIGRLSGGRWPVFQFILDVLIRTAKSLPPAHYKIVGRIPREKHDDFMRMVIKAGAQLTPSTLQALGFVNDLGVLVQNSDVSIAAGRSALECMALGRAVILLGEGGVLGLRKPEIWAIAKRTNLGDHLEPKDFNAAKLEAALREALSPRTNNSELNAWGRAQVEKDYEIHKIAGQVEGIYARALKS